MRVPPGPRASSPAPPARERGRDRRGGVELLATASLGILDELRVPYEVGGAPTGAWATLEGRRSAVHWCTGRRGQDRRHAGSLPLCCGVAADAEVAAFASTLPGEWHRDLEITDGDGTIHSSIWRSSEGGTILPFDPDEAIANLRSERYQAGGSGAKALARRAYYAVRPALARPVQIALRRAVTRAQERVEFPRWPIETALHDLVDLVRQRVADAAGAPVPHLASWPAGRSWALVLTHDVETAAGRDAIELVRGVETALGYRSSWNLVPERYDVADELVAHLHEVGCEVGVHGLRHDGRDIDPLRTMRRRIPEMRRWAERWGAVGFRAPATHRVWERMPELGFDYDTSSPDTDPYEPMSGGCCSWLPFFNEGMVELPITLAQDHTVFTILQRDEALWLDKTEFLRGRGGMALLILHPDYADARVLAAYEGFLAAHRDDQEMWAALPSEVAAWWRRRAATSLRLEDDEWHMSGPAADEAAIAFTDPTP
jgi:hypothetical protein